MTKLEMIVVCLCGAIVKGSEPGVKPNICPNCMTPIPWPTKSNPKGLPQHPERN